MKGLLNDTRDSKTLMKVAIGEDKADLAIVNARLVNVYTRELLDDHAISIKGKWIAYVGNNIENTIGPQTEVIDAKGSTVIPGLIDGHTHIAWMYTVSEFLKYVIKGGTTTVVTETMEPFAIAGYAGVVDFLKSLNHQPIKILATAPVMISISQAARGISKETVQKLLERDEIIGLGESYWQAVLQEPDLLLPLFEQTLQDGKSIEGHTAGASEKKLAAYVANGVSSCHESINAEQVLSRLRMGLHIMIREGSIRRDLEDIAKIKDNGIDLRRLILVTDGASSVDLIEKGYMDYVVQKAIDSGFNPIAAIQMATLNVAEHFSLDGLIGGIAPGRYADLVIIPDINTIDAQVVISNGNVVARDGDLLAAPREHRFTNESLNSVHLSKKLDPSDFVIKAPNAADQVQVRVIEMITDLVTAEAELNWPVNNSELKADADQDMLKIAAVDRTHNPGKMFVGFVKGFGMKSGAMACSAAWDTSDIIIVGASDADMATAVNRIGALQGGSVVCENGNVIAELPMPIFGLVSDLPMEAIAQKSQELKDAVSNLGVPFPDPFLSLIVLTGAAIPYFRICEEGLVNLKDGKKLPLFVK
ncbi:MAG: adenine deaminase [Desulfobacterales bacterium]|nr:MAG: adenine deaminase [Desulfobacterales bacterium]